MWWEVEVSTVVDSLFEIQLVPVKSLSWFFHTHFPFSLVEHPGLGVLGFDNGSNRRENFEKGLFHIDLNLKY